MFNLLIKLFGTEEEKAELRNRIKLPKKSEEEIKVEELQERFTYFITPFLSRIHGYISELEIEDRFLIYPKPSKPTQTKKTDDYEHEDEYRHETKTIVTGYYPFGSYTVEVNSYNSTITLKNGNTNRFGDKLIIEITPDLDTSISFDLTERLTISRGGYFYDKSLEVVKEFQELQRMLNRLGVIFCSHKILEFIESNDEEMINYYKEGKKNFEELLAQLSE